MHPLDVALHRGDSALTHSETSWHRGRANCEYSVSLEKVEKLREARKEAAIFLAAIEVESEPLGHRRQVSPREVSIQTVASLCPEQTKEHRRSNFG